MKSYGTAQLVAGEWVVQCDPHVMMRLKRVFGRIRSYATSDIRLKDNPEVCRELLWFADRFPLDFGADLERVRRQAAAHRDLELRVEELLAPGAAVPAFELAEPPRDYQQIAARLMLTRGRLLLADDVGLGKTVTSICAMTDPRTRPVVVVTLAHLPKQWAAEIKRFAPALKVHVAKTGDPAELMRKRTGQRDIFRADAGEKPDVVILNYHKLARWADVLAGAAYIVFDECQELRRPESQKYYAAKRLSEKAAFCMGLSATPIYNYGDEFHSVVEVISPDSLGSRGEFMTEWCGGGLHVQDPKAFGTYLRDAGIMLRRTRAEVKRELKGFDRVPYDIDADEDALEKIKGSAVELAKLILSRDKLEVGEKFRASQEFDMLMRQATGIAKAPYVAEFVRMLVESGEKVVLYGWHRAVYDIWGQRLRDLNPVMYTGSESPNQKDAAKQAFISGDSKVMIISLRAGAGLDGLQHACRTVVFGELDWSAGVHEQCEGRVYRDGQQDPVLAYYLLSDEGSDPIMADVLGVKRQQLEGVRDPAQGLIEKLLERPAGGVEDLARSFLSKFSPAHVGTFGVTS